MSNYNWTDDPTKSGNVVNVDDLNSDIMYLKDEVDVVPLNYVKGAGISLWIGTQNDYNAIGIYDANTLYFINGKIYLGDTLLIQGA